MEGIVVQQESPVGRASEAALALAVILPPDQFEALAEPVTDLLDERRMVASLV
jgi:hypothetical protein